ncbi:MAG: DUF429 domain-containing protein [Pseudomonadota bacterium]
MTRRIIYGIDFTSRPTRSKPITCVKTRLSGQSLSFEHLESWTSFSEFEAFLERDGPWIAGLDFPFGQARRFLENMRWPTEWPGYAERVAGMTRPEFRELLDDYRRDREPGDKEHKRETDRLTGAVSSQKLYGVPVALMFYEGVPRLWRSPVSIPLLRPTLDSRVALEAYPGVLARELIGRRPYKQDVRDKQSEAQRVAREDLCNALRNGGGGLEVEVPDSLVDDPKADTLDALLCAVQAAKAAAAPDYGIPDDADPAEGWIASSVR